MSVSANGDLIPVGGGDKIPLIHETLRIGRRTSCDICLDFANVSSNHCELHFIDGLWQIIDLGSTNGTKVNGDRVQKKKLRPGDKVTIGKREFTIEYQLGDNVPPDAFEEQMEPDIMSQPLLERAGLQKKRRNHDHGRRRPKEYRREYELDDVEEDDE